MASSKTPLVCRVPAVAYASIALTLATLALVCFPPILRSRILVSGHLDPGGETVAFYVASVLFLVGAVRCAIRAWRLWRTAAEQSPRRIVFALVTIVFVGSLALVGLESIARIVLPPEKVLSGEEFQRYVWVSRRPDAAERLHAVYASDRYDPDLGWSPTENYRSPDVNVNAGGLRGAHEIPLAKPEGETRIVVTGDSFSWGQDVADDEVYTEALGRLLDRTRVVNLGVHGYGTDQQYLRLKKIGFDYDPDLVILAFYKSNAARNVLAFRDYAKPRFRLVGQTLRLENVPVPAPDDPRVLELPSPGSRLGALFTKSWREAVTHTRFAEQWELTRAILDATAEETRRHGVPFVLLYIPAARPEFSKVPEAAEAALADWAEERGERFVNLRTLFLELPAEQRGGLYAGHWTPEGHRVAARFIADYLAAERLLAPSESTE